MENNKSGHISEKELDSLLNEAFLNLDFENNSKNKEVLAIVTKQAMRKDSLFTFFNVRWLNLLFLLLSFSVCLTSFYRYMDPLLSKGSKHTHTVPEISVKEKKKPLVLLPTPGSSQKSASEHPVENTTASAKKVNTHPAKNKFERGHKKNNQTVLPAALSKTNPTDSASKFTGSDPEIKNTEPLLNSTVADSSSNVSQKKLLTSSPTSTSPETKSSKKLKPLKPATKVKVGKRRRGKLFNRPTKVRKKSSRFLKDRGRR